MLPFFILIILSLFSTGIMSYISMATPIGPWIEPTLVLFAMIFFTFFYKNLIPIQSLTLTVIGSSVGGILATALGFSFPTLFFLDKNLFNSWLNDPIFFVLIVTSLSLAASLFGFWIADRVEQKFLVEQKLPYPIGELVHKMIVVQNQFDKAKNLIIGAITTISFCILQDGIYKFKGLIPKTITLINSLSITFIKIPSIQFALFPMYWAIGFVAGHVIAIPLLIGAVSKIFIVDTLNNIFFSKISSMSFVLAFCSGMVLSSAIFGLLDAPKIIWETIKNIFNKRKLFDKKESFSKTKMFANLRLEYFAIVLIVNFLFFSYFDFSILSQIYTLIFTFICTYQITNIAGKIGLAHLGRFATFVMVPAMFIFNLSLVQITFIAAFVEICGGVATDILFGRKVGILSEIDSKLIKKYQLYGIIINSIASGIFFWLLIHHFPLGSSELFAQKAQSRALLVNAINFDHYVLAIGFVFGYLLKKIKVNSMLVLGGLLMPLDISIGLIFGGLVGYLTKNKDKWYPFWSGVFASHSIWMIIQAIK